MPLAGRLTAVVVSNKPHALCFPCLATLEGVTEAAVRDAALVAVMREDLRVARSATCHQCSRVAEGLIARDGSRGARAFKPA